MEEALWVLRVYKCDHDKIFWRGFWTTPYDIGMVEEKLTLARYVKVEFLGGPNGTCEYEGNLTTYVIDRILMTWRQRQIGWGWLLKFNPSGTHIKEQLERIAPDFGQQRLLPGFGDERDGHWEDGYAEGERIMEYVQIGDDLVPILESGRQGRVVKRGGNTVPIRAVKSAAGSDANTSSSGRVGVYGGA
ncbi:MAG: hypothetical protein ACYSUB_01780 [Planctomycetota bacterium]